MHYRPPYLKTFLEHNTGKWKVGKTRPMNVALAFKYFRYFKKRNPA